MARIERLPGNAARRWNVTVLLCAFGATVEYMTCEYAATRGSCYRERIG
ncbi:MAG: hypothetical protein ACI8PT_004180 [Gammaproteobacteria bacterium]|jgi:hypothetical protein